MGEKGNLTSEELAAQTGLVASALTSAGETIRDKVIDKGLDAGIDTARDRTRHNPEPDSTADQS